MKKIILAVFLSFFVLPSSLVYAHPPSGITITYDQSTKTLKAVIAHAVSNPESHFIKTVEVFLNGKKIIQHTILKQEYNGSQTVVYMITDSKPGDILSLEAYCSISGKMSKDLKIDK